MLNRQVVSTTPSLRLALSLAIGLYVPLQALTISGALADTTNPVANMAPPQPSPAGSATPTAPAMMPVNDMAPTPAAQSASTTPTAPGTNVAPAQPGSATPQTDPQAQLNAVFKQIEKLVKKFYAKATVNITESKMHFEEKCKTEEGYYSGRTVYAPQTGGILCDITLKSGEYKGPDKDRLPSVVQDGFHANLTMAPYSKQQNKYLLVHLSYPPDIDTEFKEHFEKLVNKFNAKELAEEAAAAKAAEEEAKKKAAADQLAATQAAQQASKEAEASNEATFGAPNMSDHRFSDGRLRVLLPDAIQESNSTEMGMAKVNISAAGTNGSFNVSYLVMPAGPDTSAAATNATQAQTVVGNLPLGLRLLAVNKTGEDATILAAMEKRAKALRLGGGQANAAITRDLNTDAQRLSAGYVRDKADALIKEVDVALVEGGRASKTIGATDTFWDILTSNVVQEMHGAYTQQVFTNLKGFPGREIMVGAINDKPDSGAIVRIYPVGNYIYIVSAVGEKQWLQTPAVNKFLNSFEFFGGWGTWQDAQGWQHWQDERGWEHWHDADHHEHWWDAEHREHWVDDQHREHEG